MIVALSAFHTLILVLNVIQTVAVAFFVCGIGLVFFRLRGIADDLERCVGKLDPSQDVSAQDE